MCSTEWIKITYELSFEQAVELHNLFMKWKTQN